MTSAFTSVQESEQIAGKQPIKTRTPQIKRNKGKPDAVDHASDDKSATTAITESIDEDFMSNDEEERPKAPTSEAIFMKEDACSLGGVRSPRTG